jgi:hypothetical protein
MVWKSAENLALTRIRSLDCPDSSDYAVRADVWTSTKASQTFSYALYLSVHHGQAVLEFRSIQVVRLHHDHLSTLAVRADHPIRAVQVHPFGQGNQAILLKQKVML